MGPERILMEMRVNWGHVSAQQLERVSVGSDGDDVHLLSLAGDVSGQCGV